MQSITINYITVKNTYLVNPRSTTKDRYIINHKNKTIRIDP